MTIAILLAILMRIPLTQPITHADFDELIGYALYPDFTENCVCVPYWQCKEDFSGLIQDGIGIMDVR